MGGVRELVEVKVADGFGVAGGFGLFEELVEFFGEHVGLFAFGFGGFLEGGFAAGGLVLEVGDGFGEVGDGGGFDGFLMADDGFGFGIDLQLGFAAGAGDFDEVAGHSSTLYHGVEGRDEWGCGLSGGVAGVGVWGCIGVARSVRLMR